MEFVKTLRVVTLALAALLLASSARAALVQFSFTGSGASGSTAVGSFSVDEGSLYPGYTASGGIFPSLSLTISNIPGGGPSSVSFDVVEIQSSSFYVDANNVVYIGPTGSHNFGPPDQNHYDLGASQPFPSSPVYQSGLGYNLVGKDVITWSVATPVSVPEPGTASLMLIAIAIGTCALGVNLIANPKALV